MKRRNVLDIDLLDDAIFVTPKQNIGSLMDLELRDEWAELNKVVDDNQVRYAIVDLAHLNYFGSSVLDWMISLWKHVKLQNGGLALCNVSPVGMEILQTSNLDSRWTIAGTRAEALAKLRENDPADSE
ncbi:MAG: STAS domain-containing protein [Planctomycetales bacterium]|nr:STAS domain-containing protein [Planctomycetales bacterium]